MPVRVCPLGWFDVVRSGYLTSINTRHEGFSRHPKTLKHAMRSLDEYREYHRRAVTTYPGVPRRTQWHMADCFCRNLSIIAQLVWACPYTRPRTRDDPRPKTRRRLFRRIARGIIDYLT